MSPISLSSWQVWAVLSAVFAALMSQLKAGDRIVAPHALFGSCLHIVKNLAPQFGIETTLVNGTNADEWRAALSRPANIVFLETPSNPMLDVRSVASTRTDMKSVRTGSKRTRPSSSTSTSCDPPR